MKPFVILGASKTGTSTAAAAANAHPNVFCLFEGDFSRSADEGRNSDVTALLPATADLFASHRSFGDCLAILDKEMTARGWSFDHVGTKVQGIRPDLTRVLGDVPVLFMVRDVRLWAVKNRVLRDVMVARSSTDIAPFIIDYARYFLASFLFPRCLRLPLDRMMANDLSVLPRAIGELLGLPPAGFDEWWAKAAAWKTTAPKNYSSWVEGHTSAFMPPLLADTRSSLAPHPFWDVFLPIFDKYFLAPEKRFAPSEIRADQRALDEIGQHHTMSLGQGFARFDSFKIRSLTKRPDGKYGIEATDRVTDQDVESAADRWRPQER